MFQIWPAIDLRGGRCVRLQQGDYARETVFGDDPVAMAKRWVDEGADRLHLVDLDAAKGGADPATGRTANWSVVEAIIRKVGVACQVGGGVRSEAVISGLLACGASRLVVGTQAIKQADWFREMCRRFPGRLVLGIDAKDGLVATDGWLQTSTVPAIELARQFAAEPLAGIVYTDISRDGMLTGPNVDAMRQMAAAVDVPVIASGGVSCAADVAQLATAGVAGCIIGRALYEGRLTIAEALAVRDAAPSPPRRARRLSGTIRVP